MRPLFTAGRGTRRAVDPKMTAETANNSRRRSRTVIAVAVLIAWGIGLGLLARRELFASLADLLAEAAMRLNPGATFYIVEQQGKQIGFASNTIDTVQNGIDVTDYYVADFSTGARPHREASAVRVLSAPGKGPTPSPGSAYRVPPSGQCDQWVFGLSVGL